VIVRQETLHAWVAQHGFEELRGHVRIEQTVAVLGEGRVIPHGIVDSKPDEPAEQQIVADLLHQLPLGTHRVERLQQ
jgi:sulfur carrier protein ThiS